MRSRVGLGVKSLVMADEQELSRDLKRVWDLRTQGLSVKAIADQMGVSEGRIRWRLASAMERLDRPDPLRRIHRR